MRHIFAISVIAGLTVASSLTMADIHSADQPFGELTKFIRAGKQSNFIGVNDAGKCEVDLANGIRVGSLDVQPDYDAGTLEETTQSSTAFHLKYIGQRAERDTRDITIDITKDNGGQITAVSANITYIHPNQGFHTAGACRELKPFAPQCSLSADDNKINTQICPIVRPNEIQACSIVCRPGQLPNCISFKCGTDDRGNPTGIDNFAASCGCYGDAW